MIQERNRDEAVQATTPITVTPILVADLAVEGERMPVCVHLIDHPDGRVLVDTGMTELHPLLADMDPRLWPLNEQDIDLDSVEAVRAAPHLLPPTGMVSGRTSSPQSHWWYRCDPPPKGAGYKDPTGRQVGRHGTLLLELRSTGSFTVCPPSVLHEEDDPLDGPGRVVWAAAGDPAASVAGRARMGPGDGSNHRTRRCKRDRGRLRSGGNSRRKRNRTSE